jgi:hypothetical protein
MLRRLQPVSDLQRAQGFDDFDLTANRKGTLSPRQRLRLFVGRLAEQALAILVVMFVFALIVDRLSLATSITLEQIGLVLATAVIVMAILLLFRLRRVFAPGVKTASGPIGKYHAAPLDGFALEEITVGQVHSSCGQTCLTFLMRMRHTSCITLNGSCGRAATCC